MQQTLKAPVTFQGVGLHTGKAVRMVVRPASADYGIWFRRTDLTGDTLVPARWDAVEPTALCTFLTNGRGATVQTVEHLMAALAGLAIHNALIEIDGPEVPILDGSAMPFVEKLLARGLIEQPVPVRAFRVLKTVEVREGEAVARLEPAEMLEIDFSIDFTEAAIGRQTRKLVLSNGNFVRELSDSRTFCRRADVDMMQARGLALGGSLENSVVFDGDKVLTPGGLRHPDEPVRHKMLDAVGDLSLAGGPILGRYTGIRSGHTLTNRLLRKLFADPFAVEQVDIGGVLDLKLPGIGVRRADIPAAA